MKRPQWIGTLILLLAGGLTGPFGQEAERSPGALSRTIGLRPFLVTVQPIVVRDNMGREPARMDIPEDLVDQAFAPAGIGFCFLEPIYYDSTRARDGRINLDRIVRKTKKKGLIRGQGDLISLFFVNAVDGKKGPLGRGMMNGSITFIALGERGKESDRSLQAFIVAHEIGHNLNLSHAVDDPNVTEKSPNLMGDGPFADRIGPKSLTPYQVDVIRKSPLVRPRADALSRAEGQAQITDETYDSLFSKISRNELAAYSGQKAISRSQKKITAEAKRLFSRAVMDFSVEEREALTWSVQQIAELLQKNGLARMARHPWRFIKTENWLCGGFAFTRGLCIVLSEKRAQLIDRLWREAAGAGDAQKALLAIGPLLVHEQLHVLERVFPERFAGLFRDKWGFVRAPVKSCAHLEARKVDNPDAMRPEWLIPSPQHAHRFFWIRILFGADGGIPQLGKDFLEKAYVVEERHGKWGIIRRAGEPSSLPVKELSFFIDRFPVTIGIDHPNEIAAYMFADFFHAEILGQKSTKEKSAKIRETERRFVDWCKENLGG